MRVMRHFAKFAGTPRWMQTSSTSIGGRTSAEPQAGARRTHCFPLRLSVTTRGTLATSARSWNSLVRATELQRFNAKDGLNKPLNLLRELPSGYPGTAPIIW